MQTMYRRRGWMVCALLLASALARAQPEFDAVQIRTVPVAEGLYMLVGEGGNLGVSTGPDGVWVIDDQYAPLSPKLLAAIAALDRGPLRAVINTHWHLDHTGGNQNFGAAGALLVAHGNARTRLAAGQTIPFLERSIAPAAAAALPELTFSESLQLHVNGEDIDVRHAPRAHTDGDLLVHFPRANAWHLGDVYFAGMYPFIDGSSGGSVGGVVAALDAVLAQSDQATRIIPGHGPLSDRSELQDWRAMLATIAARVESAVRAGETREAVIAAKPTADFDARYGAGFVAPDRFAGMLYDLLATPEQP